MTQPKTEPNTNTYNGHTSLSAMLVAMGLVCAVIVSSLFVALTAVVKWQAGDASNRLFPLAEVCVAAFLFISGIGVLGFIVWDRRGVIDNRNNESKAAVGKTKAESDAIIYSAKVGIYSAKAEYLRITLQATMVKNASQIAQLPAPAIDETKLFTRPYTLGKRMVTIPLNRMKRLIEIYPETSRAAIKAASITNGDQDCSDLVAAAEMEGWISREGQGKPAAWVISPMEARRSYALLVEDALARERNKTRSFEAPSPQNALLIQPQHVYETGRQAGRQALEGVVEAFKPNK